MAVFYHDILHKSTITFSDSRDIFHRRPRVALGGEPEGRTKAEMKFCIRRTSDFEKKNEYVTARVTDKWYTNATKGQRGQQALANLVQLKEMYVCIN
jgi:hypothetical protein